jgi:hypothetical protein
MRLLNLPPAGVGEGVKNNKQKTLNLSQTLIQILKEHPATGNRYFPLTLRKKRVFAVPALH